MDNTTREYLAYDLSMDISMGNERMALEYHKETDFYDMLAILSRTKLWIGKNHAKRFLRKWLDKTQETS